MTDKVRKYLGQVKEGDIRMKSLEIEMAALNEKKYSLGGPQYQESTGTNRSNKAQFEKIVAQYDLVEQKLLTAKCEEARIRHEIFQEIEKLGPLYFRLLHLKYFMDKDWKDIAVELDYSESRSYAIHARALQRLKRNLELKEKSVANNSKQE